MFGTSALAVVTVCMLSQPVYRWVDGKGEEHFTNDPASVPKGRVAKPLVLDEDVVLRSSEPPPPRAATPAVIQVRGTESSSAKDVRVKDARAKESDPEARAAQALSRARVHASEFRLEQAEREVRQSLVDAPGNPYAWGLLGELRLKQNDAAGAVDAWERGLRYEPGNPYLQRLIQARAKEVDRLKDLSRLEGEHAIVSFEGRADPELGRLALRVADEAHRDLTPLFGFTPTDKVPIVIVADQTFHGMRHTSWAAAFYDGKVRMPGGGATGQPLYFKSVLYHEYAHALFDRAVRRNPAPAWLNEGMAELAQAVVEGMPPRTCQWGHGGLKLAQLPRSLGQLDSGEADAAYRVSLHAVMRLEDRFGQERVRKLLARLGEGRSFGAAFEQTFGITSAQFIESFDAEASPR